MSIRLEGRTRGDRGKKEEDEAQDSRQGFSACSSAHGSVSVFGVRRRLASLSPHVFPLILYEIFFFL